MAGREGRSRLWLSGCGQHFGTVRLAAQRLDGDRGPAAGVLGPVNPSCGGGAEWQSAGVSIDDFPRQLASTRRFTLGVPRAVTVSRDGRRVQFLRTQGGEDPVTCLWRLDLAEGAGDSGGGRERLVADPAALWNFGPGGWVVMADSQRQAMCIKPTLTVRRWTSPRIR